MLSSDMDFGLYEVELCFHSAALGTSGLHRSYFGHKSFAKKVYEAQLNAVANDVIAINARHRFKKKARPNVSQRVLAARAQAEKEVNNVL